MLWFNSILGSNFIFLFISKMHNSCHSEYTIFRINEKMNRKLVK